MKKLLLLFSNLLFATSMVFGQTYPMTSIDPWTTKERRQSTYYDMTSWDSSPYKELTYWKRNGPMYWDVTEYMNMRLLYPKGYDSLATNKKYPMIVMLHGAGESGVAWSGHYFYSVSDPEYDNNDHQLLWGGREHLAARNRPENDPRAFPGFVLFPQAQYNGAWESGFTGGISDNNRKVVEIIEYLIAHLNIDPNRIYIHGLSNGAKGVWDIANRRPDLFAAIAPMSGVGNADIMGTRLAHMPIWLFQGGQDTNPVPQAADQMIAALEAAGGTPRYTLYPNLGHGVWNTAYAEPDFFSWLLSKSKLSIHAYYGITEFCQGDDINVKLGVSPGFTEYQWMKNNVVIANSNNNNIIATDFGNYKVRFRRGSEWTTWSEPLSITPKPISPQPNVVASGSTTLPALDGNTSVTLTAPAGYAQYSWSNGATTRAITVSGAGSYSVAVAQTNECLSPSSVPLVVSVGNGSNTPLVPTNVVASTLSETAIALSWNDNSSNETGFEVYRATSADGSYAFVYLTEEGANGYTDHNLTTNTAYFYRIRAVNNDGGSSYTPAKSATTLEDLLAPTTPGNLIVTSTSENSIAVNWNASTDNVAISGYELSLDNTIIDTVESTDFVYHNLAQNTLYLLSVKALDISGNVSSPLALNATIIASNGIRYTYYEGSWDLLPDFHSLTPIKSGMINNFSLNQRNRNDHFGFVYEGFIDINTAGLYTFYTNSDDGSKLYINDEEVVDNDGLHGNVEKSGQISLPVGKHAISVTFFEKGGGEVLGVQYEGPGMAKQNIPNSKLFVYTTDAQPPAPPAPPLAISTLISSDISQTEVSLSWQDNANNEDGIRVYRASSGGEFALVKTLGVNAIEFNDKDLMANTQYKYTFHIYNAGGSTPSDTILIKTLPNPPTAPSQTIAEAVSPKQISLTWADNSSNEMGFEISRSQAAKGPYVVLDSVGADIIAYVDSIVEEATTYYYVLKSYNLGGTSSSADTVSATTLPGLPNAPSDLISVVNSPFEINLIWMDNAQNEDGFEIFRSFSMEGEFTLLDSLKADSTIYTDSSLFPGTPYYYKVRAYNISGESEFSNVAADTTLPAPPNAPSNLEGGYDPWFITLNWNDNSENETGFFVYRKVSSEPFEVVDTLEANSINYQERIERGFMQYTFKVVAFNDNGESAPSNAKEINVGSTALNQPINVSAEAISYAEVNLNWQNDDDDALAFSIYRADAISGPYEIVGSLDYYYEGTPLGSWHTFVDAGGDLAANATYFYKILVRGVGVIPDSILLDSIQATEVTTLPYDNTVVIAPSQLSANAPSSTEIMLQWRDNADNETNYEIYRANSYEGGYALIAEISGNMENYTDTILIPYTAYYYKIRANNENSISDFSNIAYTTTKPSLPSAFSVVATTASTVTLSWDDGRNDEDLFILQRRVAGQEFETIAEIERGIETHTDENLQGNTTYEYRLMFYYSNTLGPVTTTTLNNDPVLSIINNQTLKEGENVIIEITAEDADLEESFSFSSVNLPDFSILQDNNDGTATLTISPVSGDVGIYEDISIIVSDSNGGSSEQIFNIIVEEEPPVGISTVLYRVNSGYASLPDTPMDWSADIRGNESPYYNSTSVNSTAGWNYFPNANTTNAPDVLFGSCRIGYTWGGPIQYNFPAQGNVEVSLYFAERTNNEVNGAGQRVFDINIEGLTVLSNLDIYAEAGQNALQKTFYVNVADGSLDIILNRVVGNPIISGIEVKGNDVNQTASIDFANLNHFAAREETIHEEEAEISIFPNPFVHELKIMLPYNASEVEQIFILNNNGKVIFIGDGFEKSQIISLNLTRLNMAPGIYYLVLKPYNGAKQTFKIIKQ